MNLDRLEASVSKFLDTVVWFGVWSFFAVGFVGVVIMALLKDPAGIALLLFLTAAVLLGYWCATGFPAPYEAM